MFKPCPAAAAWGDGGRSNEFVNSCLPALKVEGLGQRVWGLGLRAQGSSRNPYIKEPS